MSKKKSLTEQVRAARRAREKEKYRVSGTYGKVSGGSLLGQLMTHNKEVQKVAAGIQKKLQGHLVQVAGDLKKRGEVLRATKLPKKHTKAQKNARRRMLRVLKKLDAVGKAPFVKGSETSRAAAESTEERKLRHMLLIRKYVESQKSHGATCDEVEQALGLLHQTASARLYDLRKVRLLAYKGAQRFTRSRCKAQVHVIMKYARKVKAVP